MEHFVLEFAHYINEILHRGSSSWYYRHEIYEVPDIVTALLITHDNQRTDEFLVKPDTQLEDFISRMNQILPSLTNLEDLQNILQQSNRGVLIGWKKQTIFFVKEGNSPEDWTIENAQEELFTLIKSKSELQGYFMELEVNNVKETIPTGQEYSRAYEDFVRRVLDALFLGDLGRATPQVRTELGNEKNEGYEIRDLLCQNLAEKGFWKDLKDKYSCTEVVFEAKNKKIITRDDLRQTYCYLKPALGFWAFIVCRAKQPTKIDSYNRTLFSNFEQKRGVLVITDDDLQQMLELKKRGHNPSVYLQNKMSEFVRSI